MDTALAEALGDVRLRCAMAGRAGDEPGGELGGRLHRAAGINRLLLMLGEGDDEGEDASGSLRTARVAGSDRDLS